MFYCYYTDHGCIYSDIQLCSTRNSRKSQPGYYKEQLVKEGNKTPAEIEEMVAKAKKQYTTGIVSLAIFGYLITGAVITAAGSALLLMRRK